MLGIELIFFIYTCIIDIRLESLPIDISPIDTTNANISDYLIDVQAINFLAPFTCSCNLYNKCLLKYFTPLGTNVNINEKGLNKLLQPKLAQLLHLCLVCNCNFHTRKYLHNYVN